MAVMGRGTFTAVADAVIVIVGGDDEQYSNTQAQKLIYRCKLFQHKKHKTGRKNKKRHFVFMMLYITMIE
jgi:hypothetical protein